MKCQLVGFRKGVFEDKEKGTVTPSVTLYFLREPNLRENGVDGHVAFGTTVYGDSVDKLPALELKKVYECDVNTFKGKTYLNNIV